VHNLAFQLKGPAQEASGKRDLSGYERLANGCAGDTRSPELDLVDLSDGKAFLFANFLQQIEAPLAPMAKGEIRTDVDFIKAQLLPENPGRKFARAGLGKLQGEWDDDNKLDAKILHPGKLLPECLDLSRGIVWSQDGERMRIECDDGRGAFDFPRSLDQVPHQLLMPKVYSVKVTDGGHGLRTAVRKIFQKVTDLYVAHYNLIRLVFAMNFMRSS
jgi:hypothetical protein